MFSARNRNAIITDDSFQIQDWLRSNGNHDRGYPESDYHHCSIRPLTPVNKRHRNSTTDGRGPDRRRQLKSMESLLGLSDENLNGKFLYSEAVTRASPDVQDSLDRALLDFEETLELAFQSNSIVPPPRGFSNHNLFEGGESNFNKLDSSFESHTSHTGSSGYSTKPDQSMHRSTNTYNELQLIREQMVKSLEIIKELEEQVKMVPVLKAQVSSLILEKQQLSSELDKHKTNENKRTAVMGDWRSSTTPVNGRPATSAVFTKDVGVNCAPICRDVGVTTPAATEPGVATPAGGRGRPVTASTTQTADVGTQTPKPAAAARTIAVGVSAAPRTYDACVTARPTVKHVGCSAEPTAERAAAVPISRATQTDAAATTAVHARGTQTATPADDRRRHRGTQTAAQSADLRAVGGCCRRPVAVGPRSNSFHHYTAPAADSPAASKIPRPKVPAVVAPEPNRKVLIRQDTYTKSAADDATCRVDAPPSPRADHDDVRKLKDQSPTSMVENEHALLESEMKFKPIQNDSYKDGPSKEMKGALKVLNDSLKKTSATLLPRVQLKQAIDVVREEWFKLASSCDCGGHLVKSYINSFTSYSPILLEFIINMTDAAGNTVLHYAISHGNFDVVSTIMDTGVSNVNLANDAGYSSIMLVSLAEVKNEEEMKIIKRLFKCGDVNLQAKKHGQTTLMLSVSHCKTEVVKLLIECGADLNIQDEDGSTALMCAAEHGLLEIVNLLLSCSECDVTIADNDGSTALSIAMEAGHREIGIALYARQHNIVSRENSPFKDHNTRTTRRSRSAVTVLPSTVAAATSALSPSLRPREYATLSTVLKTRIAQ